MRIETTIGMHNLFSSTVLSRASHLIYAFFYDFLCFYATIILKGFALLKIGFLDISHRKSG